MIIGKLITKDQKNHIFMATKFQKNKIKIIAMKNYMISLYLSLIITFIDDLNSLAPYCSSCLIYKDFLSTYYPTVSEVILTLYYSIV